MSTRDPHLLKLAKVAQLYYMENLTQANISAQMRVSRSQISRWLAEARELGIVDIRIRGVWSEVGQLQTAIERRFAIKEALVMASENRGYAQIIQGLGVLAANRLMDLLKSNMILGISWSTGVYQVVSALRTARQKRVTVVQLVGTAGSVNPILDGPDLTRWLAQTLCGKYKYLPAPLLASDVASHDAIVRQPVIQETIELAAKSDIALVGIGGVWPPTLSSLFQAKHLTEKDLQAIKERGGVGDVCGYFYDTQGQLLDLDIHHRLIGVSWQALHRIPLVIGVAGGREKASAIWGALRSHVIDCLITDSDAAARVLELADNDL